MEKPERRREQLKIKIDPACLADVFRIVAVVEAGGGKGRPQSTWGMGGVALGRDLAAATVGGAVVLAGHHCCCWHC